ncbi:MAG: excinuclease ABC subunit UvrA [Clostridiales bacterium]|nr:excinuclease ABC subunit UvrA [Clostridiales bacterium]
MLDKIIIKGAKENNLKNVSLTIPKNKLVVFSGVSGCGKSTLAFDTIFAEGQRRYMESLSSYARQFLGQMNKPDVESIDGLSPAISIDQKSTNNNPRSTVGTITEIYDYLRLLFARIGKPYCPKCGKPISVQTIDQIVDRVLECEDNSKLLIMAPIVRAQKGTHEKIFDGLRKDGFVRVMVDGTVYSLDDNILLEKNKRHDVSVIVDRIVKRDGIISRLTESISKSLEMANGLVIVNINGEDKLYSVKYSCVECGVSIPDIEPTLFSFNNQAGACPKCSGLGYVIKIGENAIVKNDTLSINEGALSVMGFNIDATGMTKRALIKLGKKYGFTADTPYYKFSKEAREALINGEKGEKDKIAVNLHQYCVQNDLLFMGIIPDLLRRFQESTSEYIKDEIYKLMSEDTCPECLGKRLNPSALSIKINKKNIAEVCDMSISDIYVFIKDLKLTETEHKIADSIINEITARLSFLVNVGLTYLTLSRRAGTLSGGEAQRIRLATQIGSGLSGVLYILDEPSIGLHQRDNDKLIDTLKSLRDMGNTLIVVEHDEDTIRESDYIVDIGPRAGVHGGEIVAQGSVEEIMASENSLTGQFLSGKLKIDVPKQRREIKKGHIRLLNCHEHNIENLDVAFPKGVFTCVTGVSGSGKSTLVNDIFYRAIYNSLNKKDKENNYTDMLGAEDVDKIIQIDQTPIGRTPRSNPATYSGLFTKIRELFASTPSAKEKGFDMGKFSFNVEGGRCEACAGDGVKRLRMYFMADVYVPCEVCGGKRYSREVLNVLYKGKSIYDVLEMTIDEAYVFFDALPQIKSKLQTLVDVGLGYIKLGQNGTTLSGGEAQRLKLATELTRRDTGNTVYVLDEPTTGLHLFDIKKLVDILQRLVGKGNTVIVIEHNLDLIKTADYIIDMGPEGGVGGGKIIAQGTPEEICKEKKSYTGMYLKRMLK